ncbi:acyltransferase domain-containing protein [Murinocardiopsis flavida]|nr:acyltransferase domain-containing protein [Murinocardiopsis flavida]
MDTAALTDALGLPEAMRDWLDRAAELPPVTVDLPARADAQALAPLHLDPRDTAELLQVWPDGSWPAPARRLLELMCARLAADLAAASAAGDPWVPWPDLAAVADVRARTAAVFAFAAQAPALHAAHARLGVDPAVTGATLADVGRHVGHTRTMYGVLGLDVAGWIALHYRVGLFELGRLQFEPHRLGEQGPVRWYRAAEETTLPAELRAGAPVLRVHIPAPGSFAPEAVGGSLARARPFFAAHLGADYPVATCTSWLLDPQLREYLGADSNILGFADRFTLVPGGAPGDDDVFRFVFRHRGADPEAVVPATRLEHAVVDHLRAGRSFEVRTGWLRLR